MANGDATAFVLIRDKSAWLPPAAYTGTQ